MGMPLAEASALLAPRGLSAVPGSTSAEPCGIFPHDPLADRDALVRVALACEAYSPLVFLEDDPETLEGGESTRGTSSIWLEMRGVADRFGGERALAQKILLQFRQQRYAGRAGIADTFGAAWALAHFDPLGSDPLPTPTLAGTEDMRPAARRHPRQAAPRHLRGHGSPPRSGNASANSPAMHPPAATPAMSSPDRAAAPHPSRTTESLLRIQIAAPGNPAAVLARLPIEALRLRRQTAEQLRSLGITRIDQLMALPRSGLAARLGDEVLRRLDQARGRCEELLPVYRASQEISTSWLAEHPTAKRDAIANVVQHLCQHLAELLGHRQQGALQVDAWLRWEPAVIADDVEAEQEARSSAPTASSPVEQAGDHDPRSVRLRVGTFRPTANGIHLWNLFELQLESISLPGPVREIKLVAITTAPLETQQQLLWADNHVALRARQLAHLIDRLSNRLGRHAVSTPLFRSGCLPEHACDLRPLTGSPTTGKSLHASKKPEASKKSSLPRGTHVSESVRAEQAALRMLPSAGQRPLQLWPTPWPITVSCAADGCPQQFTDHQRTHQLMTCWGPERMETQWWRGASVRRDYYQVESAQGERYWLFCDLAQNAWYLHGTFL